MWDSSSSRTSVSSDISRQDGWRWKHPRFGELRNRPGEAPLSDTRVFLTVPEALCCYSDGGRAKWFLALPDVLLKSQDAEICSQPPILQPSQRLTKPVPQLGSHGGPLAPEACWAPGCVTASCGLTSRKPKGSRRGLRAGPTAAQVVPCTWLVASEDRAA